MTTFTTEDRLIAEQNGSVTINVEPIPFASVITITENAPKYKELTDEEILCLWDWWSGEILSTDILDFADTYKRVLLGEDGLLEWHKDYVKKMNEQHPLGKVTEK